MLPVEALGGHAGGAGHVLLNLGFSQAAGAGWNQYAYATNPNSSIDPSGLAPYVLDPAVWEDQGALIGVGGAAIMGNDEFDALVGAPGTCLFNTTSGVGFGVDLSSPAFSPFAWNFSGTLYGKNYNQTFVTWDQYADWATAIAALPESEIYAAFQVMCQNMGCDPNQQFPVQYQNGNLVWSVSMGGSVDEHNLDGYWADPLTYLHGGNPSWYSGYFFDTPHLIGSDPISAHIDPFGPLDPFHYLIQMPSMLFPPGQSGTATCALVGGCSF